MVKAGLNVKLIASAQAVLYADNHLKLEIDFLYLH